VADGSHRRGASNLPERHVTQIRMSWAKALDLAGIPYFWLYHLRHTHARLTAAGVPDLFVAQMIGHSSSSIVQTYAKAIDEHKRDAIRKLEALRQSQSQAPHRRRTRAHRSVILNRADGLENGEPGPGIALRVRYEKRADIHEAFLSLGCVLICWRFLAPRMTLSHKQVLPIQSVAIKNLRAR
jgi:integrase-like protein